MADIVDRLKAALTGQELELLRRESLILTVGDWPGLQLGYR
jgi:hypothetical protein